MNRKLIWVALACLVAPGILRLIWFYPGFTIRPAVETPDYKAFTIPSAPSESVQPEHAKMLGGVVVLDQAHLNQFQPTEIDSLTRAITDRSGTLEIITDTTSLATRLKYAKAYVLISPSQTLSSDEIQLLHQFTNNGGKLVVFTDATRGILATDFFTGATTQFPDVNSVNPLLEQYDISVNNDYLYNLQENEGNFRNVFFKDFGKSELTFGLKDVVFYGAHSINTNSGLTLLKGTDLTLSSLTDTAPTKESVWSSAVQSEDETTLVFGDFTFLTMPFNSVGSNQSLISNIADFMLGASRKFALSNYPYIFQQNTLSILPTSDVQMTAEIVSALSRMQKSLSNLGLNVNIVDQAPRSGDLIVLGTFTPTDDLADFIKPFDVSLDDSSEFVTIPKIGDIGKKGNGLVFFEPGLHDNTLILLADSTEELIALMERATGKDLFDCILTENIGVCSIGAGGEFSTEPPFEESPVPQVTPGSTPGG